MNLFTISDLQQFSGIKTHTIRAWELRYDALHPVRSEGNTRYYDNTQLRRLLNIVSLLGPEYKVNKLCSMTDDELIKIIGDKLNKKELSEETEYYVSQLISAGMSFNEVHFDKIFSNCLLRHGLVNTYIKVIYPMLKRIGLMWAADSISPAYEHFVSNLVRQKLLSAIDALPPPKTADNPWLLFLPENEFHEIGLLFSLFCIRSAGKKAFYLGSSVPLNTLADAIKEISPSHLLFFVVHNNMPGTINQYITELQKNCKAAKIHISGNEKLIDRLKTGDSINWVRTVENLQEQLLL